ncbi:hypothetical protein J421_4785 (plasmid) [Gemmatirosa kalamazoonensis]|uniref:Uncharacterized protein n=1 Tax=Gemmatirosa kalamazoonensis TaxID=861299 RepID=W0RPQ8_9BACT|nr:hypothetical protein [Gemmatirosa kalamazoonensis]AHG92320.1 hypothetical protein J421_4785 [Gemmatirosa kalamazoonensis]
MKTPKKRDGPDLPPKPPGGGAAARLRQQRLERGLDPDAPDDDAAEPLPDEKTTDEERGTDP